LFKATSLFETLENLEKMPKNLEKMPKNAKKHENREMQFLTDSSGE
jgi:hypothetical protein